MFRDVFGSFSAFFWVGGGAMEFWGVLGRFGMFQMICVVLGRLGRFGGVLGRLRHFGKFWNILGCFVMFLDVSSKLAKICQSLPN